LICISESSQRNSKKKNEMKERRAEKRMDQHIDLNEGSSRNAPTASKATTKLEIRAK
jgi:hypothetical protein